MVDINKEYERLQKDLAILIANAAVYKLPCTLEDLRVHYFVERYVIAITGNSWKLAEHYTTFGTQYYLSYPEEEKVLDASDMLPVLKDAIAARLKLHRGQLAKHATEKKVATLKKAMFGWY